MGILYSPFLLIKAVMFLSVRWCHKSRTDFCFMTDSVKIDLDIKQCVVLCFNTIILVDFLNISIF